METEKKDAERLENEKAQSHNWLARVRRSLVSEADDGTTQELKSNRLDELINVLGEIEGKVVIWAHWQSDVRQIIKAIVEEFGPDSFVDYYGLTPQEDRQKNIKRFQDDDKCRFFIGTPQTGGYGITLTAASNMIYYSNGYDLEKRKQSEARIDRIGQTKPMLSLIHI